MNLYLQKVNANTDVLWRLLQVTVKQGALFIIFLMCVKLLSKADLGVYTYVLTAVFFLVVVSDFGISVSTSRFVAQYKGKNLYKARVVLFNSLLMVIICSVLCIGVLSIFNEFVLLDYFTYFIYCYPALILIPICSVYDGFFRGTKQFKRLSILTVLSSLLTIPISYYLILHYGLKGALISQSLLYFVLAAILFLSQRKMVYEINRKVLMEVGRYSLLVGVADLGIFLFGRFDVLALGWFNYFDAIASYELANRVFMFLAYPVAVYAQVIAPDKTLMYRKHQNKKLISELKKSLSYSLFYGFLISIFVGLVLVPIVIYLLPSYNDSSFFWFLGAMLLVFPIRVYGTVLAAGYIVSTGHAKIMTYNNLLFGFLNVIMDLFFIWLLGYLGVIISTVLLGYISVVIAHYKYKCALKMG